MPDPGPRFAVVIPMFREESGAARCVEAVSDVLTRFDGRARLITVNDGSDDGTAAVLDRLQPAHSLLQVCHLPVNRGYGAALRHGVEEAARGGFEYCLFMDSDLTNDPADIPRFAEAMRAGWDVIKATRFRSGGSMSQVPWNRRFVSIAGNVAAAFLFRNGLSDCTNGFRAVRTSLLKTMQLQERGFAIIVEELWWLTLMTSRCAEIPVILTARDATQRPTSFNYSWDTIRRYLRYAVRAFLRIPPPAWKSSLVGQQS